MWIILAPSIENYSLNLKVSMKYMMWGCVAVERKHSYDWILSDEFLHECDFISSDEKRWNCCSKEYFLWFDRPVAFACSLYMAIFANHVHSIILIHTFSFSFYNFEIIYEFKQASRDSPCWFITSTCWKKNIQHFQDPSLTVIPHGNEDPS